MNQSIYHDDVAFSNSLKLTQSRLKLSSCNMSKANFSMDHDLVLHHLNLRESAVKLEAGLCVMLCEIVKRKINKVTFLLNLTGFAGHSIDTT